MTPIADETIELQTNDPEKVVRLSRVEKYSDRSGYGCEITIISTGFSCKQPFCFDDVSLSEAIPRLEEMAAGAVGMCVIKGQWEDDYIKVEANAIGHVIVSGEIFERSYREQHLKYSFRTDQTMLLPLARDLEKLKNA